MRFKSIVGLPERENFGHLFGCPRFIDYSKFPPAAPGRTPEQIRNASVEVTQELEDMGYSFLYAYYGIELNSTKEWIEDSVEPYMNYLNNL